MAVFKDQANNEWTISLDAPTIKKIRQQCDGLDLANVDGTTFDRLSNDPCALVDAIWIICRPEAERRAIKEDQFAALLVGDTIEKAADAMLEAIADFFPQSKRELLRLVARKTAILRNTAMAKAFEKINDPQLEANLLAVQERQMDAELSALMTRLSSATNTLASAE